jgi:hypothetical protein
MAVYLNHAPEITGLSNQLASTLDQIDCALDRGDQRAFRVWAGRYRSITQRLSTLLLKILATDPH